MSNENAEPAPGEALGPKPQIDRVQVVINSIFYLVIASILIVPTGIASYILWDLFVPCTVYSEDYDEVAFHQVQVGQTREEVLASLGDPIQVLPPYIDYLEYGGETGWRVFFNEAGTVETQRLYMWSSPTIHEEMGRLPEGITYDSLHGKTREEIREQFGMGEVHATGWENDRLFFYSITSSGGMWDDRTWKRRLIKIDMTSDRVTEVDSTQIIAGNPQ